MKHFSQEVHFYNLVSWFWIHCYKTQPATTLCIIVAREILCGEDLGNKLDFQPTQPTGALGYKIIGFPVGKMQSSAEVMKSLNSWFIRLPWGSSIDKFLRRTLDDSGMQWERVAYPSEVIFMEKKKVNIIHAWMLSCFSCVWLLGLYVAHQAPLSMGFFRQEYWNGLPCPPPGDLPNPGVKCTSLTAPALSGGFFTISTIDLVVVCKPTRLFCPWDSPGKNTGVGCLSILQGIFLTQGSKPGLLHCRQILYHLRHQGNPSF